MLIHMFQLGWFNQQIHKPSFLTIKSDRQYHGSQRKEAEKFDVVLLMFFFRKSPFPEGGHVFKFNGVLFLTTPLPNGVFC